MPEQLSDKEYIIIVNKLLKVIRLYKTGDIDEDQVIEKVFGYFFINKAQ